MAGVITLKLSVMKSGMKDLDMKSPLFLPGPVEPHYGPSKYLTFEGFSVDDKGVQHYMDATVAYRQATLRCIEYLRRYGESTHAAYGVMCSVRLTFGRLLRLPGLPHVELRADSGTRGRLGGYPERVHDARGADGYFRFRHLAYGPCGEDGDGGLCRCEQVKMGWAIVVERCSKERGTGADVW